MSSGEQSVKASASTIFDAAAIRNQILKRLPESELIRLSFHLEEMPLSFKQVLSEPGDRIEYAYFVEQGVVSLITVLDGGETVETGTVGNEGMVGIGALLGNDRAQEQAVCQIAGIARRLP